jgi:ATP synthase protein I
MWSVYFLLGLFVAFISLFINAFVTNAGFTGEGTANKFFILVVFFIRVILVSVIGIIIYTHNITNMIVYIAGYSLQFVSIVLYGLTTKN